MFERYTEAARRTLFFARYEASQLGDTTIEPEHLLLGLIRDGHITNVFSRFSVSAEHVRETLVSRRRPQQVPTHVEIPFSDATKRVLNLAAEEADRLLHSSIGPEHLLLGLLREESSVAAQLLVERGMQIGKVRDSLVLSFSQSEGPPEILSTLGQNRDPAIPRAVIPAKPHLQPGYDIRIGPTTLESGTVRNRARDFWDWRGAPLKTILAEVCGVDESRIELQAGLDERQRYDISFVLPKAERDEIVHRLVEQAIETFFHISLRLEVRRLPAYAVSAPNGIRAPGSRSHGAGAMVGFRDFRVDMTRGAPPTLDQVMREPFDGDSIGLFLHGTTVEHLCKMLEQMSGRFFMDETGLSGSYDFEVRSTISSFDDFLQILRDELGLSVTAVERELPILVVRAI